MITINISKSIKCNADYSMFITFDFDYRIVQAVKEFPSKFYNVEKKEWEVPFNKLGEFIEKVNWSEIEITADEVPVKKTVSDLKFDFKTTPYDHQVVGFNYGMEHDKWLLGDEMGLGKTKQVIDIAVAKKQTCGYKHCLIVCGVNGLKWNWYNEVQVHSNEKARILGQRYNKSGKMIIGDSQAKLEDAKNLRTDDTYFIITNIETLRYKEWTGNMITKRGKTKKEYVYPITDELIKLHEEGYLDMIAVDEVHKCKNADSDQGSQLLRLDCETKIGMTGTPLMNTPIDLYIIFKWLGYEKYNENAFRNHYCTFGGFGGYEIVGYKNLNELQERLDDIMLRRLKKDVLDLPEKTYIDEFVDMTPKQAKIYNEISADIKANIDQVEMADNPLAELIRLRQATGYTGILSSKVEESAKLDRMEELVEETVSNGKKVVIFSNWTQMTDEIFHRLCKKYTPAIITGDTKDEERQRMVDHFQNNDDCQVIIGTSGAMGTGLTLTAGTVEIFLDEPWNMALKEQCVDRCHRIGQTENLTIYTIMCKNTIDERIHEIVQRKGAMADMLVDGADTMSRKELVDYLLS